jgi:hypothetical protein
MRKFGRLYKSPDNSRICRAPNWHSIAGTTDFRTSKLIQIN